MRLPRLYEEISPTQVHMQQVRDYGLFVWLPPLVVLQVRRATDS